jgi:hypothetical protein
LSASCAASSGVIIAFFHDEICHCICLAMPLSTVAGDSETICTVSESRMENCGFKPAVLGLLADDAHAERVEGAHRESRPARARP